MPTKKAHIRLRWLLGAVALVAIVGAAVAVADPDGPEYPARRQHAGGAAAAATGTSQGEALGGPYGTPAAAAGGTGACGAATAATTAAIDVHVAKRIYHGEAASHEVAKDVAHVTGSRELIDALATSDQAAVLAAVHTIVYTPHWHIVRLRVVKGGGVLADVGGPYIIAPVTGTLRKHGRAVGSFVMSVQDDVGYVKLVTRFTGAPIDLYGTPRPADAFLMGTLAPAPPLPSDGASVDLRGRNYLARVIGARAFPDGHLKVALLFAPPSRALAAHSCEAVRSATWGSVIEHIAARLAPLPSHYQELVGTVSGSTGGPAFVRIGSRQIAGLAPGPRRLPQSGPVSYRGRTWQVFSWEPYPPARIYFLAPS